MKNTNEKHVKGAATTNYIKYCRKNEKENKQIKNPQNGRKQTRNV